MMTLWTKKVTRWLSLSFSNAALAEVRVAKDSLTEKAAYDRGRIYATSEKSKKTVLLLDRHPVWGYYAGQVVYLAKTSDSPQKICEMRPSRAAIGEVPPPLPEQAYGNVKARKRVGNSAYCSKRFRSSDNTFAVFSTCSTYQPRLKGVDVDLHYFHEVCAAFCPGCYAATHKHVEKFPHVLIGTYYFPAASDYKSPLDDCNGYFDALVRRNTTTGFKMLYHPDHTPVLADRKHWLNKRPDNRCSDQGRRHIALVRDVSGVYFRDVPINNRLPILCVDGPKVAPVADPDSCYVNSEPDGKGGCRCKSGALDALHKNFSLEAFAASQGITQEGYICLFQKCETMEKTVHPPWEYLLLLVDGPQSISPADFDLVRQFAYGLKGWLTRAMGVFIVQYSDWELFFAYNSGRAKPGYTDDEFDRAVVSALGKKINSQTDTYAAMNYITDKWRGFRRPGAAGLLILITDGGTSDAHIRTSTIEYARSENLYIKVVPVGGGITKGYFDEDVLNKKEDIISLDSYSGLEAQLKDLLRKTVVCDPITRDDFNDAAHFTQS